MCKPWVDSPCDYGAAEEIAFNLYAMDCEGMFNETINVNVNKPMRITAKMDLFIFVPP